jgi:DNA-binding GntR family transcriptional regulator
MPATTPPKQPWPTPPGVARYQQLAKVLRERMVKNRYGWRPGDKIPPEPKICEESGYSRETVRAAIRVLRGEGMIHIVLGVGSYVAPKNEWKVQG